MFSLKNILAVITLFLTTAITNAQKLPVLQQGSMRAPAMVKIDGKATEWGDKFEAYNKATDVFYNIANDDDNIYLVIKATDVGIINKIIKGRVTFTINTSGKKSTDDAVTVSFPIFDRKDVPYIGMKDKPRIIEGNAASIAAADSFSNANNRRLAEKSKFIKVTGVKGVDTLISVYNEDGIKAAAAFDNQMAYTCEFAISLKLLGLSVNDQGKLNYNVTVNPLPFDDVPGITIERNAQGTIVSMDIDKSKMPPNYRGLTAATDFWGEYTLAKK